MKRMNQRFKPSWLKRSPVVLRRSNRHWYLPLFRNYVVRFDFIATWKKAQTIGMSQITGAYLESPYISPAANGAIPASTLRIPDDGSIEELLEIPDALSMLMIAPELPGAINSIKRLQQKGLLQP
jgi:N-acetylglucosamine-6-phosphate deacetylase